MEKKITHVCLLNEDPSSILSPIVDPSIPSHKLVIASTGHYKRLVNRVIKLAKNRGYQAVHKVLPDTLYSEELKQAFVKIFSELDGNNSQVWFNATNGLRIQSLTAFEVARSFDIPTYVVHKHNDSLHWIHPAQKQAIKIQDKLKLKEYVELFESNLTSQENEKGISTVRKVLGHKWAVKAENYANALASLNYLATMASGNDLSSTTMTKSQQHNLQLQELIDDLSDLGMVETHKNSLSFLTPENKFFCNGGWLEEFVFATLL
uniref:Card1-like endonuclease domain-containing protein n=1 Tax=uncultured Pseudoalteromonas sp. TaxID=114053 RepID=UPI00345C6AB8